MTSTPYSSIDSSTRLERGFTLLEVMISGIVIAIGLVGFAVALVTAHDLRQLTTDTTYALSYARYALEEIESVGDTQYITDELNGWCFEVDGLEAPWADKDFADGSSVSFSSSQPLLDFYDVPPADPVSPGGFTDPAVDDTLDNSGIALTAASGVAATTGYGIVLVDSTNPEELVVTVRIEFRSGGQNRFVELNAHVVSTD